MLKFDYITYSYIIHNLNLDQCKFNNFFRILYFLEEIVRLENELQNLIVETGKRVHLEINKVKTLYKDKLRESNVEIEFLRTVSMALRINYKINFNY